MSLKFTIVTPSFNQGPFLPQTLASVAAQSYDNYEHLIYDPGSKDASIAIAQRYCADHSRAVLFTGLDKSQTNAINLGFGAAQGDILCWLNSDDRYASADVLDSVARIFTAHPDVDIVYGRGNFVTPEGGLIKEAFVHRTAANFKNTFANSLGILQPSLFMRRSVFEDVGAFDEKMNFSFDYEYWARCAAFGQKFHFLDKIVSEAVIHEDAKTIRARGVSLDEAGRVARRYYDFVSMDWIRRIVDHAHSGADGITASSETVAEDLIAERFITENNRACALSSYFNMDPTMNAETRKGFADWVLPLMNRAYVSAWDANYFDMGVTLLASIHRLDPTRGIFVLDIGMTVEQRAFVTQLHNVIFLKPDFPDYSAEWQRNPKNYVFKNILFSTLLERLAPDTSLLWIDAGVSLCRTPDAIFDLIETEGTFFIDHDDSSFWPFVNASFTSDAAIQAAKFTWSEMAAPHVISCLYGVRTGGIGHDMIREANALAHIEAVAVGDKHPPDAVKRQALSKSEQMRHATDFVSRKEPVEDLAEMRRIFGYYGHRQDQSIVSALVTRHGMRISSARTFCPASDASSAVSKENWFEGVSKRVGDFARDDFNPGGVTFHHRGLVKDFTGLQFDFERQKVCAILGNGPTLADVPFAELEGTDCLGMNAAYRYWKSVDWYPALYCCLDTVVGMSHKEAILDLVRHRRRYGIRQFLLRRNLFDWLAEQGATDGVVCFDLIRQGFEPLHPEPVTTGSHSLAWTATIGYDRLIVAGVDCNYVEQVDGAEKKADSTLEITSEAENPNYFFSDYQKVGDKFNIPNPNADLHIRSWRNVAATLSPQKAAINVSAVSKMDAFPKLPLETATTLLQTTGSLDRDTLDVVYTLLSSKEAKIGTVQKAKNSNALLPVADRTVSTSNTGLLNLASDLLLGRCTTNDAAPMIEKLKLGTKPDDPALVHALRVFKFKNSKNQF
jgi:glycosyltransferase involved in cell wall biosynthesis